MKIVKTGDAEQFIGRNARYKVTVSNTGDTTLNNVVVTDVAPNPTRIVAAEGANVSGNTATWTIPSLAAGQERSFNVTLTSPAGGNYCNGASASAGGLRDSAQACTVWKGIPAILLEKADDPDPIQIDEVTTYTVRITNQGNADDGNVKMVVDFPVEVTPVSTDGNGVISGKTVTFPTIPILGPKQVITYHIKGKGAQAGDARTRFTLTSDILKSPVIAEESTHVY